MRMPWFLLRVLLMRMPWFLLRVLLMRMPWFLLRVLLMRMPWFLLRVQMLRVLMMTMFLVVVLPQPAQAWQLSVDGGVIPFTPVVSLSKPECCLMLAAIVQNVLH